MGHEDEIQLLFKGLSITENISALKPFMVNVDLQLCLMKKLLSPKIDTDCSIC